MEEPLVQNYQKGYRRQLAKCKPFPLSTWTLGPIFFFFLPSIIHEYVFPLFLVSYNSGSPQLATSFQLHDVIVNSLFGDMLASNFTQTTTTQFSFLSPSSFF